MLDTPRQAAKATLARLALSLLGAAFFAVSAQAATQVGVSVSVHQPGFYGRVDIGEQPPVVLYPQPIIVQQGPVTVVQRPIYLRVPPGHSRDWPRYCNRYRACGQPVYFVRGNEREWAGERERHDERRDHGGERGDRGDHARDQHEDRGHGHGHRR